MEFFLGGFDLFGIGSLKCFLKSVYLRLNLAFFFRGHLVAEFVKGFFGLIYHGIRLVSEIDLLAALLILFGVNLGFLDSLVYVLLAHIRGGGD